MKILVLAGVAAIAAGCGGGVTKEELQTMRQELLAHDVQESSKLRNELSGVNEKYISVQQLQLKVEKQLKDMDELQKTLTETSRAIQAKVDLANTNVLKVLEFEERLLAERLASIRGMIEELKKK